jgi:hypothetical protein
MKYRVTRIDGSVVGVYDASSEDEVLDRVGADSKSGFPSHEAAEAAAIEGVLMIEGTE